MAMATDIVAESFAIPAVRKPCTIQVEGIGSAGTNTRGCAILNLASSDGTFNIDVNFHLLTTITTHTPVADIASTCWEHLRHLALADPSFGKTGRIDALIGADIWGRIIQEGIVRGSINEPFAQSTSLGWVVFGPATVETSCTSPPRSLHSTNGSLIATGHEHPLDLTLARIFEFDADLKTTVADNDLCENIFMATHHRNSDGRYVVQIPFRPDAPALGNSHPLALRQFYQLEHRLANDSDLKAKYMTFMQEYIDLGHMKKVPNLSFEPSQRYIIPHHPVLAKFRVVFNASAKTSNGLSLNDTQLSGPLIQELLTTIMHRFRRFPVALSADIEKMFRQVRIHDRHQRWQQILWRQSTDEPICTYQLTTVTYGMASGPYNAVRAMQQCGRDNCNILANKTRAENALRSILRDFYVDDYLTSVETTEHAIQLANDVDTVLQQGHFHLRKWQSNDRMALAGITGNLGTAVDIELKPPEATVLGLHWNPKDDELFYRINLGETTSTTKRQVLADTARLYDPTNMLAPVIIVAKIFIQTLWRTGLDWDSPLPAELLQEWRDYSNNLTQLQQLRIPRCLQLRSSITVHLHGFCDASVKAYAAVVYLCTTSPNDDFTSALVTARTRVAPARTDQQGNMATTIPRLELCAARLLAETINTVKHALDLEHAPCTLYSDSSIVHCWIRKSVSLLKPYVANRVGFIQQHTNLSDWQHIRSHLNPADYCASRGISANSLLDHPLWWHGPIEVMRSNIATDIPSLSETGILAMAMESKPLKAHMARDFQHPIIQTRYHCGKKLVIIDLVDRFSSIGKLLRTTAYVLRGNVIRNKYWHHTIVNCDEMNMALKWHLRAEQNRYFYNDILLLSQSQQVAKTSKLAALAPYLDSDGILRVGGRLVHSELPTDQKHPIILAKESTLSQLIVRDIHLTNSHAQVTLMLQILRHRYWIISGRSLVKQCVYECVICRRHSRQMAQQQMASLPSVRVVASPPSSSSGVDYCGPFNIRIGTQRTRTSKKTYVVIFVCMATKAVHIELAEDLSARAFLNVFARFVGRRGPCSHLYSDNGTQFRRANKLLQNDLIEWNNEHIIQQLANQQTQWHFISAAAPHQGGLWEAAVKSAKRHLLRVVGDQTLHFDQLHTLLVRIEACLNSRPLVAVHDNVDDRLALSPADFLIGRSLVALPEPTVPNTPTNRLQHWQLLRQMHQSFWHRWHDEYLASLQQRSRWRRPREDLKVGDVVVLRHENLPPAKWRLARIISVHPGKDGLVRNVTVQYSLQGNTLKSTTRPAQKVCRLFSNDPELTSPAGQ